MPIKELGGLTYEGKTINPSGRDEDMTRRPRWERGEGSWRTAR